MVNETGNEKNQYHQWGGRFWHVPECFQFPMDYRRKRGLELWHVGQPSYITKDGKNAPIMPFRQMNPRYLPKKLATQYKSNWRPIMQKMEDAPGLPQINSNSSSDTINTSYAIATSHLKTTVCSYVWKQNKNFENWKVSTWSKRVSYNMIMKNGTDNDINNLPEETRFNRKRKRNENEVDL